MDARRWTEVVATFDDLVELEPDALERRLTAIASSDPELRRSVEELLAADAQAEGRLARLDQALTPSRPARPEGVPDADPLNLVGRTVSHFRVIEPLASGGMGVVYRAEDTQLRRVIALKFPLPVHHFDRSTRERFLREARVAAALDHPNLCPIHEIGQTDDGHLFFAMPLYAGETLKERLTREGALPVADAFHIVRQIAAGLGAAHHAKIVHRDLKPANVMLLGDGTLRILDFGLAKDSDIGSTDPWTTLGTVSYMAPEQVRGHEVDKRADLWALGVILHEMLTGQRPFHGEQAITVAHAIVHNDPERPSALRAGISDRADALVQTLLRKDPAQRCASAEDMIAALDAISADARRHHSSSGADGYGRAKRARLLGAFAARIRPYVTRRRAAWGVAFGVGVLAILLVGFTVSRALGIGPAASLFSTGKLSPSDSILVADFDIPGTDSSNRVMALLVRTALSQSNVVTVVQDVTIRAALQRMRLSATTPLVSAVARALAQREGFKAVVEGTLTPLGAGFMVTLGLVSAEGDHLFSVQETADLNSLVPTIERLTRKLRGRIGESLEHVRASPSLPRVTSYSIAALRKYEEGNRALNEEANHILAVQLLNEAVDLDSTFAMAWVSLTAAYRNGGYPQDRWHYALERGYRNRERLPLSERYSAEGMYFRVGPGRDRDRAAQAYAKGLLIDTGSFANSLGLLHQSRREYARAESLFRWYVDRGSNLQVAYENLSNALYFQGKKEESESVEAVRSGRFDSPRRWGLAAGYLYNRGQLDSAELMLERYRAEGDATHRGFAWYELSGLSLVRGRLGEAERARDQAGETNLARDVRRDSVAEELGLASRDVWHRGRRERGLARLDRILAQTPLASLPLVSALNSEPYYLLVARIFARARRPDRAREVLGQFLVDRRDTLLLRISEPAVHSVRGEIALAEGRPLDALQEFRRADRLPDGPIHLMALGLHADVGRAFDQAGMVDSAITSFEQYLETPQLLRLQYDAVYMPHILQRLGALYEAKGDRTKAIAYYEHFVMLWRNADPELQPRVAEARRRIELLRGGSGSAADRESRSLSL